jgi:hypothetical protein
MGDEIYLRKLIGDFLLMIEIFESIVVLLDFTSGVSYFVDES